MGWCLDCHRNNNYVGGREFRATDPTSFTVGSLDNVGTVMSQKPDPVVVWSQRRVAGQDDAHGAKPADAHAKAPETVADVEPNVAKLKKLIDSNPALKDLPSWRLANLPASHRAVYGEERFQNAPAQCSTCHQ
jgi:hypothetical protein